MGGVKIPLLDKHIKEGFPCSCVNCPIALAIKDALGPDYWASVRAETISIYRRGQNIHTWMLSKQVACIPTPSHVAAFIRSFDGAALDDSCAAPSEANWPSGAPRFPHFTLNLDLPELKGASVEPS